MFQELTRRDFIKTASMAALAMAVPAEVFAAEKTKADLVVYGKIFTSENNQIVEAFAVKDGKFVYVGDKSGAKAFIEKGKTEIMKEDGTVLKKEIRGGEIFMGEDGTPTGYLSEQAGTYTRSFLDNEKLYTVEIARKTLDKVQEQLLSEGYTMYLDGWGNYFYNDNLYKAAKQMDSAGDMHFVFGTTYEIESWMDINAALDSALAATKYASTHVKTNWIKLFMDGTVETGTGFVEPLYPDGHQGTANWEEEELTEITRKANEKGLTMHIHALGNAGVNRVVNSYVNGGKSDMRNTIVHVFGVIPSDYKRMAENNIYVTSGMLWHYESDEERELLYKFLPEGMKDKSYPMKSFFDNGVIVSSHSDFPALSGSPDDPFGIMEIAVTGVNQSAGGSSWWPEELLTREQALTALTINCAKQMFLENERGSIKTGKYADFLLVTKDVLTCPVTEIHTAKPAATYFEGKKVFSA